MSLPVASVAELNPDHVKPGWIALLIVLALCIVTFLLWRSMNTQLRKISVPSTRKTPDPLPIREPQARRRTDEPESDDDSSQGDA